MACHSKTALDWVELRGEHGVVRPYAPALEAIRQADLVVLGPGSLFTSIIPNLLVPGVVDAIRASRGRVLFVCSLADVQGETWGLTAREHLEALIDHGMAGLVDYMLVHAPEPLRADNLADARVSRAIGADAGLGALDDRCLAAGVRPVSITYADLLAIQAAGPVVLARDLADPERPTWHAPAALREAFGDVIKMAGARRR